MNRTTTLNKSIFLSTQKIKQALCCLFCLISFSLFAQPQFGACSDIEFCGTQINCAAKNALSNTLNGNCNPTQDLTVAFKIDLDNDGNYDYLGANESPYPFPNPNALPILALSYSDDDNDGTFDAVIDSLEYPVGTHLIEWTVADVCLNTDTCSYRLEAKDCTLPMVSPIYGLAVEIHPVACVVTVTAEMLNDGSTDNCCLAPDPFRIGYPSGGPNQTTPPVTTEYDFDIFNFGLTLIDFWVQDCHGNWEYTETYILVQDPWGSCGEAPFLPIGKIDTWKEDPVAEVEVTLLSPLYSTIAFTDENGEYRFYDHLYEDLLLTPKKDVSDRNGVSTLDIILSSRHMIGLAPLDSPFQLIAADVDNSDEINTFDLIAMQRLILYIDDAFTNNTSWRFVDAQYVFPDPTDPWSDPFPETIQPPTDAQIFIDFTAVKVGDINGNAVTNLNVNESNDRTFHGDLHLQTQDIHLEEGEEYVLEFRADPGAIEQVLFGYQFTLDFDETALEVIDLARNELAAQFGWSKLEEGVLTAVWSSPIAVNLSEQETLFSIKVKAKSKVLLSDALELNSTYTIAEAYNEALELMDVKLEFMESEKRTVKEFILYQNKPNPFRESTSIRFYLPESGTAILRIFDNAGRQICLIENDYEKGMQKIELHHTEEFTNGIYYYQLETSKATKTRKMAVLE